MARSRKTQPDTPPAADEPAQDFSQPVSAGTYAIYRTPDQGVLLVVQNQAGEIERKHIPGRLIKLMTKGPLAGPFAQLMGGSPLAAELEQETA